MLVLRRALSGGVCGAAAVALLAGGDDARLPSCDNHSDLRQMARQIDELEQSLGRFQRAQRPSSAASTSAAAANGSTTAALRAQVEHLEGCVASLSATSASSPASSSSSAAAGRRPDETAATKDKEEYQGMLHADVLAYMATEHSSLTEALVELARLQAIELGMTAEALRTIDTAITITPAEKLDSLRERLWMEGIAAFYEGDWERGARHFEVEMAVNGDDVEVPAWRWLCDAHNPKLGVGAARSRLLECGNDVRAPFNEIWALYKGVNGAGNSGARGRKHERRRKRNRSQLSVAAAAEANDARAIAAVLRAAEEDGSEDSKMWGNFYIGLYLEALGKHEAARTHFVNAAESGSHNNIAKLARAHLLRALKRDADKQWRNLQLQAATR